MAIQYYYCPFREKDVDAAIAKSRMHYAAKGQDRCTIVPTRWVWDATSRKFMQIANVTGPTLADVPNNAVLIIDGHGSPAPYLLFKGETGPDMDAPILTPKRDGQSGWLYRPSNLADLLAMEGLPKQHRAIRLLACFGAGPEPPYLGPDLTRRKYSQIGLDRFQAKVTFASRFAVRLRERGYTNIRVGAYRGPTMLEVGSRNQVNIDAAVDPLEAAFTSPGGKGLDHDPSADPNLMAAQVQNERVLACSDKAAHMRWYDGSGNLTTKPSGLLSAHTS